MAFRTITAKFPGTCKRCGDNIVPGDRIRFGGRGRTYHLLADCPVGQDGHDTQPVNYGGRCEDSPCCGHGGRCGIPMGYGSEYAGVEF